MEASQENPRGAGVGWGGRSQEAMPACLGTKAAGQAQETDQ